MEVFLAAPDDPFYACWSPFDNGAAGHFLVAGGPLPSVAVGPTPGGSAAAVPPSICVFFCTLYAMAHWIGMLNNGQGS